MATGVSGNDTIIMAGTSNDTLNGGAGDDFIYGGAGSDRINGGADNDIVDGGSGYLGQDEYTITFGGVGSGAYDVEVSFPTKPGIPLVVGPAQNPVLGGIRPGTDGVNLLVVRPNGQVLSGSGTVEPMATSSVGASTSRTSSSPVTAFGPRSTSPNPARGPTPIEFTWTDGGIATLTVHDLTGRRVRTLTAGGRSEHGASFTWDLRDDAGAGVPPGIYFARFASDRGPSGLQRVVVLP